MASRYTKTTYARRRCHFFFADSNIIMQGVPLQEWATGHKQLAHVIPLRSSRTKLSLYSFVDLTFCITCAPTTGVLNDTGSRWIFSRSKEGSQIFVFKLRSRSRAYDWYWQLWCEI